MNRYSKSPRKLLLLCILLSATNSGCGFPSFSSSRTAIPTEPKPFPYETNIVIANNDIYQNNRAGVRIRGNRPVKITNSEIYQNGVTGVALNQSARASLDNCNIYLNKTGGVAAKDAEQLLLTNSRVHQNGRGGVRIQTTTHSPSETMHAVLEKNRIYLNERAGVYALSMGTPRTQLTLSDNTVYRNKRSGVRIEDNVGMTAANNEIYENETAGISSYTLHTTAPMLDAYQNKIYANDGAGIFIHAGITGQIGLTNNLIHHNYRAGIACGLWGEFNDKKVDVEILHNTIFGNGSALEGAGIRNDSDGDVLIKNNIIAYNFKTGIMTSACRDNSYNLLFANGETSTPPDQLTGAASFLLERIQYAGCKGRRRGDVLAVPEFVNPDLHNFSLRQSSPAVGAAARINAPYFQDIPSTDLGVIPHLLPDDFFPPGR